MMTRSRSTLLRPLSSTPRLDGRNGPNLAVNAFAARCCSVPLQRFWPLWNRGTWALRGRNETTPIHRAHPCETHFSKRFERVKAAGVLGRSSEVRSHGGPWIPTSTFPTWTKRVFGTCFRAWHVNTAPSVRSSWISTAALGFVKVQTIGKKIYSCTTKLHTYHFSLMGAPSITPVGRTSSHATQMFWSLTIKSRTRSSWNGSSGT